MKLLLILLFPVACLGQTTIKNESVKVVAEWSHDENNFMLKVYNLNMCPSYLSVDFGSGEFVFPIKLKQFEYENVLLIKDGKLKIRNTTVCENGTTKWLIIDAKQLSTGLCPPDDTTAIKQEVFFSPLLNKYVLVTNLGSMYDNVVHGDSQYILQQKPVEYANALRRKEPVDSIKVRCQ